MVELLPTPVGGPKLAGDVAHLFRVVSRHGVGVFPDGVEPELILRKGATQLAKVVSLEFLGGQVALEGIFQWGFGRMVLVLVGRLVVRNQAFDRVYINVAVGSCRELRRRR